MRHESDDRALTRYGPATTADNLALMRRACIAMMVVGALTCLAGVWITQATHSARTAQSLLGGAFLLSGVVLWVVRVPYVRLLQASVLWAIALLGLLISFSDPVGMAPVFLLWPVVLTAYFSLPRFVLVAYCWMGVTLSAALLWNPAHTMKLDTFTGIMSTVGLMAALVATMARQQARLRSDLASAVATDPLTGLLNRRAFNPRFETLVAESALCGRTLSVIMIDVDHFKRLNDELGHLTGDQAMRGVARILRQQVRDDDLVARFGGDEFAIALPDASAEDARAYAEHVALAVRQSADIGQFGLSLSAGICTLSDDASGAERLLQRADEALLAAKFRARGRIAWWDGGIVVGDAFLRPQPGAARPRIQLVEDGLEAIPEAV